jgi:2'-5' RNA ligase
VCEERSLTDPQEGPGAEGFARLFVADRLPDPVAEAIAAWQRQAIEGQAGVRPTSPSQLHITMVFLGSQPVGGIGAIADTVRRCLVAARRPLFHVARYQETARVGMLNLQEEPVPGDDFAGRANESAGCLMQEFQAAGIYKPMFRDWRPHVTVARFRTPPQLRLAPPALGTFSPIDVVLFESMLSPSGSTYRAIETVAFAA